MRIQVLVTALVCAASLFGQRKFSWQDYCFNHPAAPVCSGHDYAVKPVPPAKDAKRRNVITNPFSPIPRTATPSLIVVGGIDWRFADPSADVLVGFNVSGLAASSLAHNLIAQLGARQGLAKADIQKIFDGLSAVDQILLSVRDNRIVVMVTGHVTELALPAPAGGMKVVSVTASAILIGHADAVDQAVQRIAMKGPTGELARLAEEREASYEFWAVGAARLVGPQAVFTGMQRFSLAVSIRDYLASDWAFEFNRPPSPKTLQTWQTTLGAVTLEGNVVHARMSIEADELQQKFVRIAASPLGEHLSNLVAAARYLPARDTTISRQTKPVIYGLEGGPRVVGQDQNH